MHHPRRSALQGECSNTSLSVTPSLSDQGPIDSEVLDDQVSIHPEYDEEIDSLQGGEVSEELASFLKESVKKPASNAQKQTDKHPLPKVQELLPPKLDMPMRLLVSKEISSHDLWLKKMQAMTYEAAGPLIHLLKSLEEDDELDIDMVKDTLRLSLSLMGNSFAHLSQERRRKVLTGINYQLGHMAEENFEPSEGVLFSDGVVDCIRKRTEAIKTLQKAKQPFRQGGVQGKSFPIHRGKQTQFHSGKDRALPYPNKMGRGGRGVKKGNRAVPKEALPSSTPRRWRT